jgi:hypothetical protein
MRGWLACEIGRFSIARIPRRNPVFPEVSWIDFIEAKASKPRLGMKAISFLSNNCVRPAVSIGCRAFA